MECRHVSPNWLPLPWCWLRRRPAEFGKFLKEEYDRWGKVVREKGIEDAS